MGILLARDGLILCSSGWPMQPMLKLPCELAWQLRRAPKPGALNLGFWGFRV